MRLVRQYCEVSKGSSEVSEDSIVRLVKTVL